jgi:hypothetical protein
MLQSTTQAGIRWILHPSKRWVKTRQNHIWFLSLNSRFYSDTMLTLSKKSTRVTCAHKYSQMARVTPCLILWREKGMLSSTDPNNSGSENHVWPNGWWCRQTKQEGMATNSQRIPDQSESVWIVQALAEQGWSRDQRN